MKEPKINHLMSDTTETYKIWYLGRWYGHNSDVTHFSSFDEAYKQAMIIKTGDNRIAIAKETTVTITMCEL